MKTPPKGNARHKIRVGLICIALFMGVINGIIAMSVLGGITGSYLEEYLTHNFIPNIEFFMKETLITVMVVNAILLEVSLSMCGLLLFIVKMIDKIPPVSDSK